MRTLRTLAATAALAMTAVALAGAAIAATVCQCTFGGISAGGQPFCMAQNCQELLVSAPRPPALDLRSMQSCSAGTLFVCPGQDEGGACYLACEDETPAAQ